MKNYFYYLLSYITKEPAMYKPAPRVEIYRTTYKDLWRWRFRIKAANNKIVAHGEGYVRKASCLKTVNLLLALPKDTEIKEV